MRIIAIAPTALLFCVSSQFHCDSRSPNPLADSALSSARIGRAWRDVCFSPHFVQRDATARLATQRPAFVEDGETCRRDVRGVEDGTFMRNLYQRIPG